MGTWSSVVTHAAEGVAVSVPVVSILIAVYAGLAVAVALSHPDWRRRRDARAVLEHLTELRPRRRRGSESPTNRSSKILTMSGARVTEECVRKSVKVDRIGKIGATSTRPEDQSHRRAALTETTTRRRQHRDCLRDGRDQNCDRTDHASLICPDRVSPGRLPSSACGRTTGGAKGIEPVTFSSAGGLVADRRSCRGWVERLGSGENSADGRSAAMRSLGDLAGF